VNILLHVCRAAVIPSAEALLLPYLDVSVDGGQSKIVISKLLRVLECDYDIQLDLFFSPEGWDFIPEMKSPTQTFTVLYNGNIQLLWIIQEFQWTKDMCDAGTLKDLAAVKFCSDLNDEQGEDDIILSQSHMLAELHLTDVITFASDIQKLKGKDECEEVCGGKYVSVLCKAFTEMSLYVVDKVIKKSIDSLRESTPPPAASVADTQPREEPSPSSSGSPLSAGASSNLPGPLPPITPQTSDEPVNPGVVSSPVTAQSTATGTTTASPALTSEQIIQTAVENYLKNPDLLNKLLSRWETSAASNLPNNNNNIANDAGSRISTSPSTEAEAQGRLPSHVPYLESETETEIQDQLPSGVPYLESEVKKPESLPSGVPLESEALSSSDQFQGEAGPSSEKNPIFQNPSDDENGLSNAGEANKDSRPLDIDNVPMPDDDFFIPPTPLPGGELGVVSPEEGGGSEAEDEEEGETQEENDEEAVGSLGSQSEGDTEEVANSQNENVVEELSGEDDEEELEGGGYRSIHFFSILLVLTVFSVTAYLCVHNKKRIKETMKDYVSENQKKRRTRGYQPLLSGKK
jgi:hypothetical protein